MLPLRILVVNDDGINSPGLAKLVALTKPFAEVLVVAPDRPRSGMSRAITIAEPVRLNKVQVFEGILTHTCSGTPTDCVKLALGHLCKDHVPALVVSGINHGSNVSNNVLYSGTVCAAMEATLHGVPAIGFSLCDYDWEATMAHVDEVVSHLIDCVLKKGLPQAVTLNVNLPAAQASPIAGIRYCRQAKVAWQEKISARTDPDGRAYFWIAGDLSPNTGEVGEDVYALTHNYASVVPCRYDLTDYASLQTLQDVDFRKKT